MSLAPHTSLSLPRSLQSTAFPCYLFSPPFHASTLHRLASDLNYDLHVEVATNGHFQPHPQQYWTKLTNHSPLFVAPPPGSKISDFLPCPHGLSQAFFLALLPQPIFQCWHILINYKGKTVALSRESWQVAHQPSNIS